MPSDKINQVLRDRKSKNRKVAHYRKQRILNQYNKQLQQEQQHQVPLQIEQDQANKRKIQFYNKVFDPTTPPPQKQKARQQQTVQVDEGETKIEKLKNRQKHFIRKMKQKTPKGQPLMRNYVKYALAKLEESLEKQKKQKAGH